MELNSGAPAHPPSVTSMTTYSTINFSHDQNLQTDTTNLH
jgi:hypothetical protein